MKSKMFAASLASLALILAVCIFAYRQASNSSAKLASSAKVVVSEEDLPEGIRTVVGGIEGKQYSYSEYGASYMELSNRIKGIVDVETKQAVALAYAKRFLAFRLENDTVEKVKVIASEYTRYVLDVDKILRDANVDGRIRSDFLFSALGRYREYCCRPIPDEGLINDFSEWNDWANAIYGARWDLLDNLKKFEHDFNWIFRGLDDTIKGDSMRRIVDFHVATVKEVERMDAYQRKHKRRPPKMLCSYPVNYERTRNISSVIYIGDNEIDIKKWESGEKEKIIADILLKSKKAKGTTQLTTEDVEIKVDGID